MKQKVDIPVPRRGSVGALQGLRPGQSSTAATQQNVATPVPSRGGPRGGLQGFPPDQGSAATFPVPLGDAGDGFFRTFSPPNKSAKVHGQVSASVHGHSSSSDLSAHRMAPPDERISMVDADGHTWVRLDTARGSYWQNVDTEHTQWHPPWER